MAGQFTWTPHEADGPGVFEVTVCVTDSGSPSLSATETFTITVNEVNVAPSLTNVPATATINELAPYAFTAQATDSDLPVQTLSFSLVNGPTGASINPATRPVRTP